MVLIVASVKVAVAALAMQILVTVAYIFSRNRNRQLEQTIAQTEYELSLLTVDPSPEQRAERLYLKQQFELKRYYDEALRQSSSLSYIGAACVLGGFVVVGVALALLRTSTSSASEVVVVSGVGGLLANFVAVVFLGMHSLTIRSMGDFHSRLVGTNHIHMANTLISRMRHTDSVPDRDLNKALPLLAVEIVRNASRPSSAKEEQAAKAG